MRKAILLALFLLIALPVGAKTADIGVYLNNVHSYDAQTGNAVVDLWITLKCDYDCTFDEFVIQNSVATASKLGYKDDYVKSYSVQAQLSIPVDMRAYPFDDQRLLIIIENSQYSENELTLKPLEAYTAIDSRVSLPGWKLGSAKATVVPHWYTGWNANWSSYVFEVPLDRPRMDMFFQNMLPVLFLVLIVMFTFILEDDKLELRLGIVGSILVALVVLHLSLTDQLPALGYLTFFDKFITLTYAVALGSFFVNIVMLHYRYGKNKKLVRILHNATRYLVPALILGSYLLLFWAYI